MRTTIPIINAQGLGFSMEVLYLNVAKPFLFPLLIKFTSKTKGFACAQLEVYDFLQRTNNSRDRWHQFEK